MASSCLYQRVPDPLGRSNQIITPKTWTELRSLPTSSHLFHQATKDFLQLPVQRRIPRTARTPRNGRWSPLVFVVSVDPPRLIRRVGLVGPAVLIRQPSPWDHRPGAVDDVERCDSHGAKVRESSEGSGTGEVSEVKKMLSCSI